MTRLLLATALLASQVSAAPPFRQPLPVNTGVVWGDTTDLLVADFNGDGGPDLVTSNNSDTLVMVPGNGFGPFAAPVISAHAETRRLASADLNGDGKRDVISTNIWGVSVRLGNGDGTFGTAALVSSTGSNQAVIGDFTGDGKVDVVVSRFADSGLALHAGNGAGALGEAMSVTTEAEIFDLAAADINGDGRTDLIAASAAGAHVYLGSASGLVFAHIIESSNSRYAVLGNLNGDAVPDLVLGHDLALTAFAGNGGSFTRLASYPVPAAPRGAAIADMNGDGFNDVAVAAPSAIAVLRGTGTGALQAALLSSPGSTGRFAVADFDADGKRDAVTLARRDLAVHFLKGNGDGTVGSNRAYLLRQAAGTLPFSTLGAAADVTGDNKPDAVALLPSGSDAFQLAVMRNDGAGGLLPAVLTEAGSFATRLTVGRIDGDAFADAVVVVFANGRKAATFFGRADGTFAAGPLSPLEADGVPLLADASGDGKADLLIGSRLYAGNGSGAFATAALQDVSFQLVGDLDRNGTLDTVWVGGNVGLRNPNGTYAKSMLPGPTNRFPVALADFNGDTFLDVCSLGLNHGASYVYLGRGDGTFEGAVSMAVPLSGSGSASVATGDFDGDGKLDLLYQTDVLFGNGDGRFRDLFSALEAGAGAAADFDANGRPDIVAFNANTVALLRAGLAPAPVQTPAVAVTSGAPFTEYAIETSFNATVTAGNVPPTGAIVFAAGGVPFGINYVSRPGTAGVVRATPAGVYAVTATYTGSDTYLPATGSVQQSVSRGVIDIRVTAPDPTTYGTEFKIPATMQFRALPYLPGPSKSLTLRTTDGPVQNIRWADGGAYVLGLGAGNWGLWFEYPDNDENYLPATVSTSVIVSKRTPSIVPTILPAGTQRVAGPVTFKLTLPSADYGVATGGVLLRIDERAPVNVSLMNTNGTYTTNLAAGTYGVALQYPGDRNHTTVSLSINVPVYAPWGSPVTVNATTAGGNAVVRWTPLAGATSYTLYKKTTFAAAWQSIGLFTSTHTEPIPASTTWMYAVAARNESDTLGPMSAPDLATSVAFTDDPPVARFTRLKRAHVTELRNAVNAVRTFAGLTPFTFTDTTPVFARAIHIAELRTALSQARSAIGMPVTFTDPTLTPGQSVMRAVHVEELRNAVR